MLSEVEMDGTWFLVPRTGTNNENYDPNDRFLSNTQMTYQGTIDSLTCFTPLFVFNP